MREENIHAGGKWETMIMNGVARDPSDVIYIFSNLRASVWLFTDNIQVSLHIQVPTSDVASLLVS